MVRPRALGRAADEGAGRLTAFDDLVRPALQAAFEVARSGAGEVPPLDTPRGLRPFLHFSRLPDRALGAARRALDDDEAFRHRVAEAVDAGAVGRAAWLFAARPDGWRDELEAMADELEVRAADRAERQEARALTKRVGELEALVERIEEERDGATASLEEARARLAAERRARRLAETEAGRLRQRVARLEESQVEVAEQLDRLEERAGGRAAADDEVVRLRAELAAERRRAAELEDAGVLLLGAGGVRIDREAMARAVRSAAEAIAVAATAIQALDEASAGRGALVDDRRSSTRPPDGSRRAVGVRRAVALPGGVFDDSREAADHLVRVRGVTVLVDGYNITKLARPNLTIAEQRRWLDDAASGLAARTGASVQLVFDGAADDVSVPAERPRRHGVQIRFSKHGQDADDVLIDLVGVLPPDRPVVVATNDRRVREACRSAGANVISAEQLLAALAVTPPR